jgi:structural maintenance of chromosome 4
VVSRAQSKPNAKDLARIETLDAEIASSTEELEELQTKTGAIEAAIKALEKKILEIGGSKLLKQKSTVDGIRLLHQIANEEVTKAEVMKATAEKNIVKYTSGVETNRAALEEVEQELEELKDQLAEVAQYLEDLKEKVEAAQAAQESSKDDLDQLKQQLQEKREEIDEFRKKEVGYLLCD